MSSPFPSIEPQLPASFSEVTQLVQSELNAAEKLIQTNLASDVDTVASIGEYIVESGGKRLRPMIAVLVARALGNRTDDVVTLAVLLEFLHTATLLHDDVVDRSQRRRGTQNGQLAVGECAERSGWGFPLFSIVPAHGATGTNGHHVGDQ